MKVAFIPAAEPWGFLLSQLYKAIKDKDGKYEYVEVPLISKDAIVKEDKIDSDEDKCWRIIDKEEYRLYIPKYKDEVRLENLNKARYVHNSIRPEKAIKKKISENAREIDPGKFTMEVESDVD